MVVYDRSYEMPARVTGFDGSRVALVRPAGLTWSVPPGAIRPATAAERRQLRALAALHKVKTRGTHRASPLPN
ncbi:hypothetical protein GPA10_15335 [Streptomyces sp. p1417]|uniref:Uncharacterized protein n=2 Tax=Streptomyces typhae TaxID=2681492 RepID=A0A6L6WWE0_9ACTN|nr:hypothetical protein [Streptomyces typhae]